MLQWVICKSLVCTNYVSKALFSVSIRPVPLGWIDRTSQTELLIKPIDVAARTLQSFTPSFGEEGNRFHGHVTCIASEPDLLIWSGASHCRFMHERS